MRKRLMWVPSVILVILAIAAVYRAHQRDLEKQREDESLRQTALEAIEHSVAAPCKAEVRTVCASDSVAAILTCLQTHRKDFSAECAKTLPSP